MHTHIPTLTSTHTHTCMYARYHTKLCASKITTSGLVRCNHKATTRTTQHLWGDPTCDNSSECPSCAAEPRLNLSWLPWARWAFASLTLSCSSSKPDRWGRQSPLKISGLCSMYVKPCSDHVSLPYTHVTHDFVLKSCSSGDYSVLNKKAFFVFHFFDSG